MSSRLIIDGNAVYEIDEECMKRKSEQEMKKSRNTAKGARLKQEEEQEK